MTDQIEDYPVFTLKFIKLKYNAGNVEIFNVAVIDEKPTGSVIYAVEGIFDAFSFLQIGAEGVVAINGTPHWKKTVDRIKTRATNGLKVVILFDDDNAGRQAAENTRQALITAGIPAIARFLSRATDDTSDEKNYANYILQNFGATALCESFFHKFDNFDVDFAAGTEEIANRTVPPETAGTEENRVDSATEFQDESAYFIQNFDEDVQRRRKFAHCKTGFSNIDEHQFFHPDFMHSAQFPQ